MTIGIPLLPLPPSQASSTLSYSTVFLEDDDLSVLQTAVNSVLDVVELATPSGGTPFLVDIQYQTSQMPGGSSYSVMLLFGQWNPT